MSFLNRLQADTRAIFSLPSGIAEDVQVQAGEAEAVTLRGFFEVPTLESRPETARIVTLARGPRVSLLEADVQDAFGRAIARGDLVTARGTVYRVENARPDGLGLVVCDLKEKVER